jgi:hypothetical protein
MSNARPPTPPGLCADPAGVLHRLTLPYTKPPEALRANSHPHWSARSRDSRQVRTDVATLARAAGLHLLTGVRHVTVQLVWAPGDRRHRDPGNLAPFQKALLDGLTPTRAVARHVRGRLTVVHHVGVGLIPDDGPEFATELMPVIVPPPGRGMWFDVWVQQ